MLSSILAIVFGLRLSRNSDHYAPYLNYPLKQNENRYVQHVHIESVSGTPNHTNEVQSFSVLLA